MSNLHIQAVSPALLEIIKQVNGDPDFLNFRLCRGTALALQIGHRVSVDADFVCEKSFDISQIIALIHSRFKNVTDVNSGKFGVFLKANNIKVDFLSWNIPFIRDAINIGGLQLTHIEEIIAMKLFAILQRGEKKDYMDIASLLNNYSLQQMIGFYKERHKGSDDLTVIRYLTSYNDIESQPEPVMLNRLNWNESKIKLADAIKSFFK